MEKEMQGGKEGRGRGGRGRERVGKGRWRKKKGKGKSLHTSHSLVRDSSFTS